MFRNKRGISPLIASVLLIAFAVTLFLIISTWVQRSVVEPGLEEGGEKIDKTLACLSAKVNIVKACHTGDTSVTVDFDNDGDVNLDDITLRVLGTSGSFTMELSEIADETGLVKPLERKSFNGVTVTGVTGIDRVEVFSVINGNTCQSNPAVKTNIKTC